MHFHWCTVEEIHMQYLINKMTHHQNVIYRFQYKEMCWQNHRFHKTHYEYHCLNSTSWVSLQIFLTQAMTVLFISSPVWLGRNAEWLLGGAT